MQVVQQPCPREQATSWASCRVASCGNDLLPIRTTALVHHHHQRPFSTSSSSSDDGDDSKSDPGTRGDDGRGHQAGRGSSSRVERLAAMREALRAELGRIDGHVGVSSGGTAAPADGSADGPGPAEAAASSFAYPAAAIKKAGRLVDRLTVVAEAGGGGAGGLSFVSKYR